MNVFKLVGVSHPIEHLFRSRLAGIAQIRISLITYALGTRDEFVVFDRKVVQTGQVMLIKKVRSPGLAQWSLRPQWRQIPALHGGRDRDARECKHRRCQIDV